jgi:pseudouridine-5'-phosphate glycosidase
VLVVVPCPEGAEIPYAEISGAIDAALAEARSAAVTGAALTPFLLSRVASATAGRSLAANLALLENNARIAGRVAAALG